MLPQLLTTFLDSATAFALPVTLLASSVSTVVVAAGWRRRRELLRRQGRPLSRRPDRTRPDDVRCRCAGCRFRDDSGDAAIRGPRRTAVRCAGTGSAARPCRAHRSSRLAPDPRRPCVTRHRAVALRSRAAGRRACRWPGADHCVDDGPHPDRALQASRLRPAESSPPCREPRWRSMYGPDRAPLLSCGCPPVRPAVAPASRLQTLDPASTSAWQSGSANAVPPGGNESSADRNLQSELAGFYQPRRRQRGITSCALFVSSCTTGPTISIMRGFLLCAPATAS